MSVTRRFGRTPIRFAGVLGLSCLASLASSASALAAEPTKDQCIDANESAQGLRKGGKLREAEQRLLVCVSSSCPGPVRDDCAQRLSDLRAVIPSVVFAARDDADQDLSAVKVTIDGAPLVEKLDGTALPLDPGEHHFTFEAAGHSTQERVLVVREGERDRHERILFLTVGPEPSTPATLPATPPLPPEAPPSNGKTQRMVGLTLGGVGVAGLLVGGIFGLTSKSKYDSALSTQCGSGATPTFAGADQCTQAGLDADSSARTQAAVSTVAFIAGGAFVAGGLAVYFSAPKRKDVTVSPAVGSGTAGLSVRGSW